MFVRIYNGCSENIANLTYGAETIHVCLGPTCRIICTCIYVRTFNGTLFRSTRDQHSKFTFTIDCLKRLHLHLPGRIAKHHCAMAVTGMI